MSSNQSSSKNSDAEYTRNLMREMGIVDEAKIAQVTAMMNQGATITQPSVTGEYRCFNMGCSKKGMLKCSVCNIARYCSKECQKADWKPRHKATCGKDRGIAQMDPMAMLNALDAWRSGGWYAQQTRKRLYERLWMSFQFRTEDEYAHAGNMVGYYQTAANGSPPENTSRQFREHVGVFRRKGMLPPDWSAKDDKQLFKKAEGHIHFALEKSDIVDMFGYSSGEHSVLRSMAENALGPIGNWIEDA
jgi:hypothetical protein